MFQRTHRFPRYLINNYFPEERSGAKNRFPRVAYYGVAALSVGAAAISTAIVSRSLGQAVYSLFFAAVMVSTWFGGLGPGLFATVLATVCIDLVIPSGYSDASGFLRLAVFFLVALLTNSLIGERNRTAETLRLARNELEARVRQRTAELAQMNDKLRAEIAERREAEARLAHVTGELIERNTELWRLQRERGQVERLAAIGRVTGTIAHDLGTPLNSVLGYTQLLAQEKLSDVARHRLDIIAAQVQRIVAIVDRHLSRVRSSLPKYYSIDLNRTVGETLELFKPIFEQRAITVAVELARDLPPVRGDDASLQRVIINLLDNALDALGDDGTVRVTTKKKDASAIIEIADDGAGIPPELLPTIFEPFVTSKAAGKGSGLGLAISHEIVRSHGGTIDVSSKPDCGTSVAIVLPAEREATAPTRRADEPQDPHCGR